MGLIWRERDRVNVCRNGFTGGGVLFVTIKQSKLTQTKLDK